MKPVILILPTNELMFDIKGTELLLSAHSVTAYKLVEDLVMYMARDIQTRVDAKVAELRSLSTMDIELDAWINDYLDDQASHLDERDKSDFIRLIRLIAENIREEVAFLPRYLESSKPLVVIPHSWLGDDFTLKLLYN
ncbi:MAG: hypothetical protein CL678_16065 [Bdellovibrionaceae bacterium]|nr:hypothetical protein [Pseudobdellovibrionaceae bacterium]|tara:strand:- start:2188 stop:2601 length:414 start_codon:yes stop_codon:yes gene_type:complete